MTTIKNLMLSVAGLVLLASAGPAPAQAPAGKPDISQRLDRIEHLLNNQGLLDMLQRLNSLQQQLQDLRGELEVQGRNIEELRNRQRALYADLDQRLQVLEGKPTTNLSALGNNTQANPPLQTLPPAGDSSDQVAAKSAGNSLNIQMLSTEPAPQTTTAAGPNQQPATGSGPNQQTAASQVPAQTTTTPTTVANAAPATTPENTTPAAGTPATTPATGGTATANVNPAQMRTAYQQAFDLLKQAKYEQAIQALQAFLVEYPSGEYSDNAQYWLGEAYYVMRQFDKALVEYQKVINNFPQSQKYTHAMLKIGYCYQELGRVDDAKKELQALVQQYPGETASRLAEERLKNIALTEQQTGTPAN